VNHRSFFSGILRPSPPVTIPAFPAGSAIRNPADGLCTQTRFYTGAEFGETLISKNQIAQVNELLGKVIEYNLTVVSEEMYEDEIEPNFLKI
jgi:hypothetical protein